MDWEYLNGIRAGTTFRHLQCIWMVPLSVIVAVRDDSMT